ncbi:MAG: hypothetical protein HXY46_12350 [Syntrophaceae bacterium]|nr:hypothetical protein [Syntrophaceae bacterium]
MPGGSDDKILIITQEVDPHADLMVVELRRRGVSCLRWHTASFPLESCLTLRVNDERVEALLRINGREIDIREIRSVWYRRPEPFQLPSALSADEKSFAEREVKSSFSGFMQITDWFWVNHPDRIRVGASKILQLKVAREVGLPIPRTLITNEPEKVKPFFDECRGQMIYKALNSGFFPSGKGCLTTPISRDHLKKLHLIRNAPGIFQEYVPKRIELRVTIIGRRVFAAEIHSQDHPETKDDWRAADVENVRHCPHALPHDIEAKCLKFIDRFGLAFGAVDMILTPDGRYVFLENNPSGQFGWIEDLTRLPLTETLAEMLIAGQMI